MRKSLLALVYLGLLFCFTPLMAQTGIYINEVMGSNKNTIADSTGSYEDWLELYNSNSSIKPLNGYYITNDITNPKLFRLSGNLQIPAHGFILLWASKDTTRGKTHLPFKISASGENLYLYATDGHTLVDSLAIGQQKTDVSYGRNKDGSATFSFFAKPTPRATNNTSTGYIGILNPPVFSKPAGFYGSSFSLSITSDDPSAKIIYSTDGSNPDASNTGGTAYRYKNKYQGKSTDSVGPFLTDTFRSVNYVNPINVKDASTNPNRLSLKSSTTENSYSSAPASLINKGTVVRAVATRTGYIPSEITTATYFVTSNGQNKYTLPILSLSIPENDLYSWDSGIYNAGTDFDKWRINNPSATVDGFTPCNWTRSTEFMSSLELFTANNTTRELQTNIGLAINGAYSRAKPQKAFRVYFRNSYGANDLNYQLYSDLPYKNYDRLVLSNAGNDMTIAHMRDMTAQGCLRQLNFGSQRQQPTIAFVNGEFWGILNARQRYDDNYFRQIWNIDTDSLDFGENQSTANNGTNTAILNLRSFINSNSMTNTSNYQSVQNQMDIDNFIDYNISEIFFGNTDWPGNNLSYFRKRVPYTPGAPLGQDGRFRWIINDMDRAFGLNSNGVGYNTLAWATGTSSGSNPVAWSTIMLRQLLTNTEFRTKFITRYADLLNTTFLPANVDGVVNYYRDLLSPHIAEHTARWRYPSSASSWNTNVDSMIKYENARPSYARQHIRSQFSLGTEKQLTIDVSDSTQGFITVNTIDITPSFQGVPKNAYPWTGLYYQEVPVTLVAKPKQGYRFLHWSGDSTSTKDTLEITLSKAKSFTAVFQSLPVTDSGKVITYWHFNNQPTGTLTSVAADTSLAGNAVITYEGTGAGFMDRTTNSTEGSTLNLQFNKLAGWALRARNPSNTRSLLIKAPTSGYKNIVLKYATSRTSSGAQYQRVFYTTDVSVANPVWVLQTDSIVLNSTGSTPELNFTLQTFDFSNDVNTANNSKFAVKIVFFGSNATGSSGNNRFDNITINGIPLSSQDYPTVSVSSDKNNVCSNSKVTFTAKTTNAGASPTFQWIKNNVNVGTNQSTFVDSSFQNQDAVYCKLTVNDTTLTSNKIFITVVSSNLSITSLTKNSPSACGNNDGDITINRSGGTSPFQYSLNNVNYFTSNSFTNLGAGTYTTYVKDSKGCSASLTDVLVKIPALTITLSKTSPSACSSNNGSITINNSGGNSPFKYSLNNVDYFSTNVFSSLAAGTYTVYVKDADDCIASVTDVLANTSALVITGLDKTSPSGCTTNDGTITINNSGGTSPFKYSLDNIHYFNSNIFSNLAAGTYTAYVKDAQGCTTSFTDVLPNNSSLVLTGLNPTSPTSCITNDGSITINASGGSSPFQYSLDNVNYSSGNVFNGLGAGTYTGYVRDNSGCTASFTDAIDKYSSSLVIDDLIKTSASACRNDGSISIKVNDGYLPFQYSLNNVNYNSSNVFTNVSGGTFTAYVKDAKGCIDSVTDVLDKVPPIEISLTKTSTTACSDDGTITVDNSGGNSPFQYSLNNVSYSRDNVFDDLKAGAYTAYVKDADGCIDSLSDVLTRIPIGVTLSTTSPSACGDDGSITISNSGGAPPYQYSLNNVDYFSGNLFANLAAGTYTGYVKDANGCIDSLPTVLNRPSPVTITSLDKTSASSCIDNGKITIHNTGGTSPYQYSLDNINYFSSNIFSNLASGTYTAYVKDAKGCIGSFTDVLDKLSPVAITSLTKVNASACRNDGTITINTTDGTSPYKYSLDNVNYFSSNVFTNLAAGPYTAYVKDATGCSASLTDALTGTSSLVITSLSKTNPSACSNNGVITINNSGGTSPYKYSLDNVNYFSSNVFTNLAAGSYTAYVKDARGCTASLTDALTGTSSLVITSLSKTSPSACSNDGKITINNTGGASPYQFSLDNINYSSGNTFTNLAAGSYTAYVKDATGCTASLTDVLAGTPSLVITSLTKTNPSACSNSDGKITINNTGGTSPYQYSLNNVDYFSSNVFTNLATGNYTAYVKDAKGCTASITDVLNCSNIAGATDTLGPLADAFVRNGTYVAINYGSDTSLIVKSSTSSGLGRTSYLKFSLSSVSNVVSAKLRIYGKNTENTTSIKVSAYGLNNDTWTENGITWNNAPAADSAALAVVGVTDVAKYYEVDVTGFVQGQFTGDKVASFLLKDAAVQNKNLRFNSKENKRNRPQLIIVSRDITPPAVSIQLNGTLNSSNSYISQVQVVINSSDQGGSGLTSTQYSLNGAAYQTYNGSFIINTLGNYTITAKAIDGNGNSTVTQQMAFSVVQGTPVTQTLSSVADAFVRNGSYAAINYGSDTSLLVKGSTASGFSRTSYLKFSLSSLNNVVSAKLRIYGKNTENTVSINVSAYGLNSDTWTENGITWNNAPTTASSALAVVGVTDVAKYYEVDVTGFVQAQLAGDKVASFLLKDAASQNRNLQFNSKENKLNRPQLVIQTTSSAMAVKSISYDINIPDLKSYSQKVKVYPNPLHGKFEIKLPYNYGRYLEMEISDELGRVYEIGKRKLNGEPSISVNIANLSLKQGIYFLRIKTETKSEVIKLLIQ